MKECFFYRFYVRSNSVCETCYYISTQENLNNNDVSIIEFLIDGKLSANPSIREEFSVNSSTNKSTNYVERGPKLRFQSTWGVNAKHILHKCGITKIERIEKFIRGPQDILECDYDKMVQDIYQTPLESFNDTNTIAYPTFYEKIDCTFESLYKYNISHHLGIDDDDLKYYYRMWNKQCRSYVTELEMHDLAQCNSEHSRHNVFRADLYLENHDNKIEKSKYSLMDIVKTPLNRITNCSISDNSVVAFSDNSSAIKGCNTVHLVRTNPSKRGSEYYMKHVNTNTLFSAETHNFPTGIAPFPGAATGTGGRIRDVQAIGQGGMFVAGSCGYCVSSLGIPHVKDIENALSRSEYLYSGAEMLIQASNGASDYGNKIGEPVIQGFTRTFGMNLSSQTHTDRRIEWIKPIMFTSGIGIVYTEHLKKNKPETDMLIARIGGPAYRIGVGGGTASSTCQTSSETSKLESSVQRGDPEMEQKMDRFLRSCIEYGDDTPIYSIHDQGAGGMCNVTKEIVETENSIKGATIDIRKVVSGDESLTLKELWIAEYQEQNTFLTTSDNVDKLNAIANRENVSLAFVGIVTCDGKFRVYDSLTNDTIVDFTLNQINELPRKKFILPYIQTETETIHDNLLNAPDDNIEVLLGRVLKHPTVGSKRFLTNKVDRSVSGLIAQQQCVGPLHTPLADAAIISHSYFQREGAVTSIGEKPIIGIANPAAMARMAVGEMLTNMMCVKIEGLHKIKCSGNWMWPAKDKIEKRKMFIAANALSELMCTLQVSIDGGKDSLSMSSTTRQTNKIVDCPPQIVISGYTSVKDVTDKITPDLKTSGSALVWININNKYRLGGSILTQIMNADSGIRGFSCNDYPDVDVDGGAHRLADVFNTIQMCVHNKLILSAHDVSDGGMITTVLEMAFAGNKGLSLDIDNSESIYTDKRFTVHSLLSILFSEELGIVIEIPYTNFNKLKILFDKTHIHYQHIGYVTDENRVSLKFDGKQIIDSPLTYLRDIWESTSFELEKMQTNIICVEEERKSLIDEKPRNYLDSNYSLKCSDSVWQSLYADNIPMNRITRPYVAVIREEGSNGDREMCAALWSVGFQPCDVMTSDMIEDLTIDLMKFSGIVFVGGFTFSDVFGAAKGWEAIIRKSPNIKKQFDWFYSEKNINRFSLGVCNGCQLMSRMGWVGTSIEQNSFLPPVPQHNISHRFESRFVKLRVLQSNAILLQGMENSVLGTWVAHGEGRYGTQNSCISKSLTYFPLRYVQHDNEQFTENYPYNPNGSRFGIAGAKSKNGLHLAMMPHPERCIKSWQNPWYPKEWQPNIDATYDGMSMPWTRMFKNALDHWNMHKK